MSRFYHPRQGNRQPPCSYHADRPAPERKVSAKYSCGFPDPQVLPIIVESKDI